MLQICINTDHTPLQLWPEINMSFENLTLQFNLPRDRGRSILSMTRLINPEHDTIDQS